MSFESSRRPRASTVESMPCASALVTQGRPSFAKRFAGTRPVITRAMASKKRRIFRGMLIQSFRLDAKRSSGVS